MVEKLYGKEIPAAKFRQLCREYAEEQIARQKKDFIRLGIIGDWDNPYKTMNFGTEANIVRNLGKIQEAGYLVKGEKPVHFCLECGSALAEAEVEYKDKVSPALDVAFEFLDAEAVAQVFEFSGEQLETVEAVIWTTTPWTLPANQGISVHPELVYQLVRNQEGRVLVLAKDLVESATARYGFESVEVLGEAVGLNLENLEVEHPFLDRVVPIIVGEHVTADAGTGLVHTAPAHGLDDYIIGQKYDLPIDCPVMNDGRFRSDVPRVASKTVWEANEIVIAWLQENGRLLAFKKMEHSYPHCWRHKTPIIFRATAQWFITMDKVGVEGKILRDVAMNAVDDTEFFPAWGRARLESMISGRPDWCVSRQRNWGVPMAFFAHKETGELHPKSAEFVEIIAKRIEQEGIEAWFKLDKAELLDASEVDAYDKLPDTLDVWFDSGSTHFAVLKQREELKWPADLYLEGSDQHRGWFQSSMLTACATGGRAPYNQLLTHGFVVDGKGQKMSKSIGNVIAPQKVNDSLGADILRLWVASTDYSGELAISDEILKRTTDSYRRLRNTIRFLLANLSDFDPITDAVAYGDMLPLDRYAVVLARQLQERLVGDHYPRYAFHYAVQDIVHFCADEMGAFYLDILKDRLYTMKADSRGRRSAQTALYHITRSLILGISPILCFTAEEAWEILAGGTEDSVLYHTLHEFPSMPETVEAELAKKWQAVREVREAVNKEIETKRAAEVVGSSWQAAVSITAPEPTYGYLRALGEELRFVLMVSKVSVSEGEALNIVVDKAEGEKCERCWHYLPDVGSNPAHPCLCARCIDNVEGKGEERLLA